MYSMQFTLCKFSVPTLPAPPLFSLFDSLFKTICLFQSESTSSVCSHFTGSSQLRCTSQNLTFLVNTPGSYGVSLFPVRWPLPRDCPFCCHLLIYYLFSTSFDISSHFLRYFYQSVLPGTIHGKWGQKKIKLSFIFKKGDYKEMSALHGICFKPHVWSGKICMNGKALWPSISWFPAAHSWASYRAHDLSGRASIPSPWEMLPRFYRSCC